MKRMVETNTTKLFLVKSCPNLLLLTPEVLLFCSVVTPCWVCRAVGSRVLVVVSLLLSTFMDPLDLVDDPVELMDPMDPMDLIELVDLIDLIDPVHRLEFLELIDLLVFVAFYFSELSIEVALIFFSLKWEQKY